MHTMTSYFAVISGILLLVIWFAWRTLSRQRLLPCPAMLSWLVELENPLARVTRAESIIKLLEPDRGARVADIGCGPGRVTLPLARVVGPEGAIYALDIQAAMLEKVAAKAAAEDLINIRLVQGDARKQMLPEKSLDSAVAVMSLGETPDQARVFAMVHLMLKPGGRFLVSESLFDPHYLSKSKVIRHALSAGFAQRDCLENIFAYAIVFERLRTVGGAVSEMSKLGDIAEDPEFAPA